jgi:tRNA/tmRNA/rRNA uracil-C5-methylase (TrmA/RlmC/RlmD family)
MSVICQARLPASRGNKSHGKVKSKLTSSTKSQTSPPQKIKNFIPDANSELQCPHFAQCSGCTLGKNLASPPILDEATTFFKEILGCENFKLHAGPAQGWRHRARLAVRSSIPDIFGNNKTLVGLFKAGSHDTLDIPKCTVHHPALNVVADLIRLCITMCEIDPYDERSGKGQLRYIQLAIADVPREIEEKNRQQAQQEQQEICAVQVVLVWNAPELESSLGLEDFAETLWLQAATKLALALTARTSPLVALHSIHANFQPQKNNVILGPNTILLHGSSESWTHFKLPTTTATFETPLSTSCSSTGRDHNNNNYTETITVPISFDPNSFMQANPTTMTTALQSMRSWIMPGSNIVDLHAGIGTIGLVIAATIEDIASLRAVEVNPSAEMSFWKSWRRLKKEKAASRGTSSGIGTAAGGAGSASSSHPMSLPDKVEYFVAAAGSDPERWLHGADVAILDPPRKGLEPELLDYLCSKSIHGGGDDAPASSVKRLLYLSCGFPAFQRDCQRLLESNVWKLVSAEAFLFFPGADHIEILAVFDHRSK